MDDHLPPGWFREWDPARGRWYYFDRYGSTQWEKPPARGLDAPQTFVPFSPKTAAWIDSHDSDDVGMEVDRVPPPVIVEQLLAAGIPVRATSWAGGQHPRLGTGAPMIVGYKPPKPWSPTDEVAEQTMETLKKGGGTRAWVRDVTESIHVT